MLKAIADTHTIIWYVYNDPRLSSIAKTFFETAATEGNQIGLSSVSLAEVVYLSEKGRIPAETFKELISLIDLPDSLIREIPFEREIAEAMFNVDRAKVPDLPDRMIAATALQQKVPLISRDRKIQASAITTIW